MSIHRPDRDWIAQGSIGSVDFDEKLIEFHYQGDLQPLVKGRYVIIPSDTLLSLTRRLSVAEAKPNPNTGTTHKERDDG